MQHPFQTQPEGGIRGADASLSVRLAGFVGDSIVDGPGLRCTLFCQGCPHHCPGCHNPETHPFEGGTLWPVEDLLAEIARWPLCRGITFSGGDPFCQADALCAIARPLRDAGYELAAYTGFVFEDLLKTGTPGQKAFLSLLDVLVDGPYIEAQRNLTLRFRGSENQRVIDVQKSLLAGEACWIGAERWVGKTQAG